MNPEVHEELVFNLSKQSRILHHKQKFRKHVENLKFQDQLSMTG
jgi:hypothetical protein